MAMIRKNSPLVQDQATIDYVACVANAIVEVLEDRDAAMYWELAIVNQPDVNAFVMPGGKIVVKSGILSVAQNQHQLAAVLGHEVAHVTAHHANERATRGELASYGVEVLALILGGGYYNQTRGAYGAASTLNTLGTMNPISRMQESEADVIGLEYMAKAGFDPVYGARPLRRCVQKCLENPISRIKHIIEKDTLYIVLEGVKIISVFDKNKLSKSIKINMTKNKGVVLSQNTIINENINKKSIILTIVCN